MPDQAPAGAELFWLGRLAASRDCVVAALRLGDSLVAAVHLHNLAVSALSWEKKVLERPVAGLEGGERQAVAEDLDRAVRVGLGVLTPAAKDGAAALSGGGGAALGERRERRAERA